jgi:cell division transport system permease protein
MGRILYFFREALRGLYQAKLMTSVSVIAVAVALTVIYLLVISALNVSLVLRRSMDQVDISLYLYDTAAADSSLTTQLHRQISALPQVDSVWYISKQQARDRFVQLYGEQMLNAVQTNPLPASFDIRVFPRYQTPQHIHAIIESLGNTDVIESVDFSPQWLERLNTLRRGIVAAGIFLFVICIAVLHFIVSNTVKLTIYARRELVVNMRYVGATDRYIATPFILEGVLQGGLGAMVTFLFIFVLRSVSGDFLQSWGPSWLMSAVGGFAILSGWLGSRSAVKRFLS